jgi:hypothetical protein
MKLHTRIKNIAGQFDNVTVHVNWKNMKVRISSNLEKSPSKKHNVEENVLEDNSN